MVIECDHKYVMLARRRDYFGDNEMKTQFGIYNFEHEGFKFKCDRLISMKLKPMKIPMFPLNRIQASRNAII